MARSTDRVEILFVNDKRVIREGLTQTLASAGFDVRLASGGRTAVQAFLLERPDLVMLNVMMPGMDGYAICEEMRKIDRELPIVFLSALDSEQDQIRGLEVGADDYVSKTASEAMLLARVKKTLEHAGQFSLIEAPAGMTKIQADIYRPLGSERSRFFCLCRDLQGALRRGLLPRRGRDTGAYQPAQGEIAA